MHAPGKVPLHPATLNQHDKGATLQSQRRYNDKTGLAAHRAIVKKNGMVGLPDALELRGPVNGIGYIFEPKKRGIIKIRKFGLAGNRRLQSFLLGSTAQLPLAK